MENNIPEKIRDQIIKIQNVPRGTFCNFVTYFELLKKWNPTINLVAKSTLDDFWERHLLDSAQIYSYFDSAPNKTLIDFGSGAGFPGMVLAMMGLKQAHLVESDSRKCVFLNEVARTSGVNVKIHNSRIENTDLRADYVTARALAPLEDLIVYAKDKINPKGKCVFLKGRDWADEVKAAKSKFTFDCADHPSITDTSGRILVIENIKGF